MFPSQSSNTRVADAILTEQVRVTAVGSVPLPRATAVVGVGREGTHPDPAKKASVEGAMIRAAERKKNLIADTNSARLHWCKVWKHLSYDLQNASVLRACTTCA